METKDIRPRNEKGQAHGCQETYFANGQLSYKENYVNGKPHGYQESYWDNGNIHYKGNYINGKIIGLWEWYHHDGELKLQIFFA